MFSALRRCTTAVPVVALLASTVLASDASLSPPPPALSPSEFRPLKIARVETLTHDTKRFTVAFPKEGDTSGIVTASCIVIKNVVDGKDVVRPYTPVSPASQRGTMDLIIKTYPAGVGSKAAWGLKAGDVMQVKGPFNKFAYEANQWSSVSMVAGGTGIAPMYQVILEMLSNPRDKTEIRLIYASRTEEDIILRTELDALATVYPNFKVLYTLSKPSDSWKGATGHVNKDMITSFLPSPQEGASTKVLVCGPPGFMATVSGPKKSPTDQGELVGLLKDLKYKQAQVFKF